MTAQEFREEFNLRYNNALEGAPGLDTFEISSYLTIAQEQYVKTHYDGTKDVSTAFEYTEKCRRVLAPLVRNKILDTPMTNILTTDIPSDSPLNGGMTEFSSFWDIADDVMYIVSEHVATSGTREYKGGPLVGYDITPVIPVTHDEFHLSYKNPFRKPSKRKVWRMDSFVQGNKVVVELIPSIRFGNIQEYRVRYLAKPKPIIVQSFETADDTAGLDLTIEGYNSMSTCILNDFTHREIINIAVQNAVLDYRESSLQGRVQLDSRA
tara:strand:- start:1713 stop:2510 length:798 start_codon:yes stop_codon:yes gene_type:complete